MKRARKLLLPLLLVGAFGLVGFYGLVPGYVERRMNHVRRLPPYPVQGHVAELHRRLIIADLHADSLLWNRDLLERSTFGHVDIPRLLDANVALQAFTVVTQVPRGQNAQRNASDAFDLITPLAYAQRWPWSAIGSLKGRALYQSARLHEAAVRSKGRLVIIKTRADLDRYLDARDANAEKVAGFLGIEGAQCLEGELSNLDDLFAAGFRMLAPTHFVDNELGGSAHGEGKSGLTDFGRSVIARMEAMHMLVDVAHASPPMVDDILAIAKLPVVSSHTGVKGTCDSVRNLSDEHIRGIAATGGVVGIGVWREATCGTDAAEIAEAMRYVADLVGIEHVALGSDFDGAINAPFEVQGIVLITEALLAEGFQEEEISKIMGLNTIRVLRDTLPLGEI